MITLDFEKRGKMSLCDFIVESIKKQILSGKLVPDEKLPSKRSLSQNLGVSIITVQNAYSRLISEGFIYSEEKVGFFVEDLSMFVNSYGTIFFKKKKADEFIQYKKTERANKSEVEFFTDFRSNAAANEKFPFSEWASIMRSVLKSGNEELLKRQSVFGVNALRLSIARYLSDFRNMIVKPEQIVIGAGTETLYTMLIQFLGKEKKYAVENPGYQNTKQILNLNKVKCIDVPLDSQGFDVEYLRRTSCDIAHVSPSHHFPTGIVMPIKRRALLIHWAAQKKNRFIIEDDYDSEFRFNGKPLPTLQSQDKNGTVIYMNTFSKTLSPAFRISYMVLPVNLINDFENKMGFYSCPVSAVEQYALSRFIDEGYFEKHIIRMKNYYRNLRNQLINAFEKSKFRTKISILEEGAGLHFLLKINSRKSYEMLQQKLFEQKINAVLLSEFYSPSLITKKENAFVINYSGIKKENIYETVLRMEKVFV